jgi:hypothetical protein
MTLKINGVGVSGEDTRICVVMVGLPARGKSFIAQKGKRPPTSWALAPVPFLPPSSEPS